MKLYNRIFVPAKSVIMDGGWNVYETSFMGSKMVAQVEPKKDQICMTIEELSQLWNAGHSAGMEDAGAILKKPAVDFETYLKDKGINI